MKKKELTKKQKDARVCNLGTMTPAMKTSMVKNALRKLSMFWRPINKCKSNAKIGRRKIKTKMYKSTTKTMRKRELNYVMINYYLCNICKEEVPEKTHDVTEKELTLKNNLAVDHINPCITHIGFTGRTEFIDRLLDENINNYQLLCKACHKYETDLQNKQRKDG